MVVKHVVTEQMPSARVAYKLCQIVSKTCVSFGLSAHSQEMCRPLGLFHSCDKAPVVRASPYS